MQTVVLPIFLFSICTVAVGLTLLVLANLANPARPGSVKSMPYESGMDPFHDARRRFDVRFHLLAIAFLVFDVELLFLYPWAVASHPVAIKEARAVQSAEVENSHVSKSQLPLGIDSAAGAGLVKDRELVFLGAMIFIALLTLGFVYDWRKGIFQWH